MRGGERRWGAVHKMGDGQEEEWRNLAGRTDLYVPGFTGLSCVGNLVEFPAKSRQGLRR